MIILQTIAEPPTAADGGTAAVFGSVVPSAVNSGPAPAAEPER
jgi:hypothetical protein